LHLFPDILLSTWAVIGEEQALLCCDHQKPDQQGLRAKGEVIKMISVRLEERKTAKPLMWPLRKLIPS
jgi:hypothetical protein